MYCLEDEDIWQWLKMLNVGYSLEGTTCSAEKMMTSEHGEGCWTAGVHFFDTEGVQHVKDNPAKYQGSPLLMSYERAGNSVAYPVDVIEASYDINCVCKQAYTINVIEASYALAGIHS
ncbi:hypothetical protein DPMN_076342 [Dreissena polymorpha]|uniref:Uncharacterized protein n=1 Tax=Dreissena polymorpha TaxID=45954 RepID=A0A9D4BQF2_DREPO|nr:hypothetical protein DPMN_076342 [Dreissena polymorpha]